MKIVQLYDPNLIRSIMLHEDILPTIVDDTWDGSVYMPDVDNEIFLGCVVDELIGVLAFNWVTGVTLEVHVHILNEFREKYALDACKECMRWVLNYVERCKKIDCYVPTVYPNVKQFAAKCGFVKEGVSRNSHQHKGQLYDRTLMGITRDKMQEFVNG